MDPNRPWAHEGPGDVYVRKGQLDVAIREYRRAVELSGNEPWTLSALAYADGLAGKRAEALDILRQLNAMSEHRPVLAMDRVAVYIGLGDKQQALAWLEKAYDEHDWEMMGLKADPIYDGLRSDPGFQDIVRRIGL